jgi:hypothetical protein
MSSAALIPLDPQGAPDLQALVQRCGGYHKITPETWAAWDRAVEEWPAERRADVTN